MFVHTAGTAKVAAGGTVLGHVNGWVMARSWQAPDQVNILFTDENGRSYEGSVAANALKQTGFLIDLESVRTLQNSSVVYDAQNFDDIRIAAAFEPAT